MGKTAEYKTSDYLQSEQDRAEYLKVALESNDDKLILLAMREIIDSMGGMSQLSQDTGLARESIYRTLSKKGNPRFDTLIKLLDYIGLEIDFIPKHKKAV